jgi:hypothetical protein
VPGGLFKSPNLEAYTTAMNVSQREGLGADGIMANDTFFSSVGSRLMSAKLTITVTDDGTGISPEILPGGSVLVPPVF